MYYAFHRQILRPAKILNGFKTLIVVSIKLYYRYLTRPYTRLSIIHSSIRSSIFIKQVSQTTWMGNIASENVKQGVKMYVLPK